MCVKKWSVRENFQKKAKKTFHPHFLFSRKKKKNTGFKRIFCFFMFQAVLSEYIIFLKTSFPIIFFYGGWRIVSGRCKIVVEPIPK